MIVAIADIHAYEDKLSTLWKTLKEKVDLTTTEVVFLGDYVDGGPSAMRVLDTLILLQAKYPHFTFLMGNHEDMMLAGLGYGSISPRYMGGRHDQYFNFWWSQGGKQTHLSYLDQARNLTDYEKALIAPKDVIFKEHIEWMKGLPLIYETDMYIFVHGGLAQRPDYVKTEPGDMLWLRDQFIYSEYDWGKKVIFGHTYHEEPVVMWNKIGIDTMNHGGGYLTAVILYDDDTFEFIRV